MSNLILEDGSARRLHHQRLVELVTRTTETVRVATAYVTDRELLTLTPGRERQLLISFTAMDIASGATSVGGLTALINSGVECRSLSGPRRLHAKVYIFGRTNAVVTSANLTGKAFNSNIEAGFELHGQQVTELADWFGELWQNASEVTQERLSELKNEAKQLRSEYLVFSAKVDKILPQQRVQKIFSRAKQCFVCNTNQHNDPFLEREMFRRGFACAWTNTSSGRFNYQSRMEQVRDKDLIFMYVSRIGIIGVGEAVVKRNSPCKKLIPGDRDRIRRDYDGVEWRIRVRWLAPWVKKTKAYNKYTAGRFAFQNVTNEAENWLRIKKYLLSTA